MILLPTDDTTIEVSETPTKPDFRCDTPVRLAALERDLQQSLHHTRIENVLAKRQLVALQKKSKVIEQGLIKEAKFGNNKKQVIYTAGLYSIIPIIHVSINTIIMLILTPSNCF